jgi:hypothetical protein
LNFLPPIFHNQQVLLLTHSPNPIFLPALPLPFMPVFILGHPPGLFQDICCGLKGFVVFSNRVDG